MPSSWKKNIKEGKVGRKIVCGAGKAKSRKVNQKPLLWGTKHCNILYYKTLRKKKSNNLSQRSSRLNAKKWTKSDINNTPIPDLKNIKHHNSPQRGETGPPKLVRTHSRAWDWNSHVMV